MSPWEKLLEQPHSRGHFVQLYEADEGALTENVGQYLRAGLAQGDGVLVIATLEHRQLFCEHLNRSGLDLTRLLGNEQLVLWDAQQTLSQFMVAGQPDWERFESVVRMAMQQVRPPKNEGSRAYGEMVGLLWKAQQFAAAIRLEQLWNRLLEQSCFSLYCSYAIDIFGQEFGAATLDGVLCTHTHMVPAQPNGTLEIALNRSMNEVLGSEADRLRGLIGADYHPDWAIMPTAEATILWLRRHVPQYVDRIVAGARHHYGLLSQPGNCALPAEPHN